MRKLKNKSRRTIATILSAVIIATLFVAVPISAGAAINEVLPQVNSQIINTQSKNIILPLAAPATPNSIAVSAVPATGGTPTATPTEALPGALVTLAANPEPAYAFQRWESEPANAVIFANAQSPQTSFVMPGEDVIVRAVFQQGTGRNLIVNVGQTTGTGVAGGRAGAGRTAAEASTAASAAQVNSGGRLDNTPATAHIHAIAATGQTFSRWQLVAGGGTIADSFSPTTTISIPAGTGDVTIRAEFGPTRTVTVQRNNNDWGTANADQTSSAQHRRVNLSASPASGFTFLHWEVAGSPPSGFSNDSIQNRTSATQAYFTMPNANVTVRAVFQSATQSVTISTNNISGANANARAPGVTQGTSIVVTAGQTVTLTATPPSGHALANWEVIGSPPSGFNNASIANRFDPSTIFTMPTGSVQIRANFAPGSRVTVQSNNVNLGTAVPNTGAAANGAAVTVTATPTTGNRFVRWEAITPSTINFANAENATTTFTMPNSAATVRAVFESAAQTIPTGGGVTVSYTISGGNVTLSLPNSKVTEIINATASGTSASLDLRNLPAAVSATFPRDALTQLANANRGFELRFAGGTISLNRDAANSIGTQVTSPNITASINTVAQGSLTPAQRDITTFEDRIFRISITSGAQTINTFSGSTSITVPYTGALPVSVWRLTDAGSLESISATHNASAGTVTFFAPSLGLFVVGQERSTISDANPFNDVNAGQWFFNDVMFVNNQGLMGATSVSPPLFSPNMSLNRAMIVTILHRREGTPAASGVNPFTDVPSGQWFTEAVLWAAENDIVTGYAGRFNPLANITRQDLAVILMRYADFMGISLPSVNSYQGFNDSHRISGYARDAVMRCFEAGIIAGRSGNMFAPLENSSRAEAAAMLHRFFTQ